MSARSRRQGLLANKRGRAAERRVLDSIQSLIRQSESRCKARLATPSEDRAGVDIVVRRGNRPVLIQVKSSRLRGRRAYYEERGIAVVITGDKSDEVLSAELESIIKGVL